MSDLAATNCGCGCETRNNGGCGNIIWIILLLSCCGGWGNNNNSCGCSFGNDSCIWIILLLFCCGGWATAAAVSAANLYRPGPRASDYMCFGREIPPDFPSDFLTTTIFDQKDYSLSFQKLFPSQTLCHICFAPHHSPFVSLPFAVATHMSHQSHTHYFPL